MIASQTFAVTSTTRCWIIVSQDTPAGRPIIVSGKLRTEAAAEHVAVGLRTASYPGARVALCHRRWRCERTSCKTVHRVRPRNGRCPRCDWGGTLVEQRVAK